MDKALDIQSFFKELKIQELMTAETIDELGNVLFPLILQFKKIMNKEYDTKRIYQLIEVLSRDLSNQILKILSKENLMFCPFNDFKSWIDKCNDIFKKFEEGMGFFISRNTSTSSYARGVSSAITANKTSYHFTPLKNRLDQLSKIR